ncbi:hypothetical protein AA309_12940 [Microvirga vignae]|uniref:Uncharacterized protein n=1 Tax=Microvirga vignae TaxID=1225564 RepID=A0A0H1RJ18_9HYPH|nr:hypothetical protein AA309_12940 [Microvirga vignae]
MSTSGAGSQIGEDPTSRKRQQAHVRGARIWVFLEVSMGAQGSRAMAEGSRPSAGDADASQAAGVSEVIAINVVIVP